MLNILHIYPSGYLVRHFIHFATESVNFPCKSFLYNTIQQDLWTIGLFHQIPLEVFHWPIARSTRMHSSRMRTGRSLTVCRSLLLGGGGGLLPGGVCSGGCAPRGVSAPQGVSAPGGCSKGCLLWGGVCSGGVSAPGWCLLWGVCSQGGVCSGGCLLQGGCLLWRVSAPGDVCSRGVSAPREGVWYPNMH